MCTFFCELLTGQNYFHTECEHHAAIEPPFYFSDPGWFFQSVALQTNASTRHDGCAEQTPLPSQTTTTSTLMAAKLII